MKSWLPLALCICAAAPALAQPAPKTASPADDGFDKELDQLFVQGGLTSDQAANRAGRISPDVQHRVAEIQVAIQEAITAEVARIPVVGAKISYTRLSSLPPINFGSGFPPFVFPSNSYVAQATASVPLTDYIVRFPALVESARLGEQAARTSARSTELSVGLDARQTYYEWVRSRLQVLIARRQLAQVTANLGQFRALAEAQRLSRADLLRVESQQAEAEQTLDQLTNLSELREEQLRILIGAPTTEQLAVGEDIRLDVAVPPAAAVDEMFGLAAKRRLDLRAVEEGISAREKQRDAEKANQYPTLSAFATVDYDNPNQRVFPQEAKFTFTWLVGAQVTWTLNGTLVSRSQEKKIIAQTDQLRADRENLRRGIRIEVLSAQQAVLLAQHALSTTHKGLIAAEEGYRVRRELLNAERATAVELVDAETDLTRARIAALNARVDLRLALAQLAHALGDDTAVRATP